MTRARRVSLWEAERMTFEASLDLTASSLQAYADGYHHWAIAYSGGKDSSALVTLVAHLIETGRIAAPKTLDVLYADTRMELPPLQISAMQILRELEQRGIHTQVVLPTLERRFFVYMFGRGVPPPKNHFRWCTQHLKVDPMQVALRDLQELSGEKMLLLTGVRVGESAARDQRIALSCGRDGAECGQGWFQETTPASVADTLAPILHWRVCHIWDWLTFHAPRYGFSTQLIAEAYGGDEAEEINARTGCVGCNLASRDVALETIIRYPRWQFLAPLEHLRPLYAELTLPHNRLRKVDMTTRNDGTNVPALGRMGPLTIEARRYGLASVLQIQDEINHAARLQGHPEIDLLNAEEKAKIEELLSIGTWPNGWNGTEVRGDDTIGGLENEAPQEYLVDGLAQRTLFGD